VLVVAGLRVRVAIDGLQCPLGILKLHLCVFLLLGVHLLLALPLAGRRAILALLLHLFAELFHELLDLPTLRRGMARGVVQRTLRAAVVAIGRLMGRLSPLGPPRPPPAAAAAAVGTPASGWLPPAFFFLLLPLPPPWAWAPALGLLSPFATWGGWGVPGTTLCSLGALVRQAEERGHILDAVDGELLQHLLIPYPLAKCNHYKNIGDTRNGIANLREPLDEGAQGFPRALLDGMEIDLISRPSISALKDGRELAA
jgi:hypothetical protein